jgi:hypothetical protein
VVVTSEPTAENPELIALGADLEIKVAAYRAAAARRAQARTMVDDLWPAEPAPRTVAVTIQERAQFTDCFEVACFPGDENVWQTVVGKDGKVDRAVIAPNVLRPDLLRELRNELRRRKSCRKLISEVEVCQAAAEP